MKSRLAVESKNDNTTRNERLHGSSVSTLRNSTMQSVRPNEPIRPLPFFEKIHALHRFYRYKWRTESDDLTFLMKQHFSAGAAVDIGANKGIYSYFLSRHFSDFESVYAFEPQPSLYPYLLSLKDTFDLNKLSIVPKGLSSQEGTKEIFFDFSGSGGAGYDLSEKPQHTTTQVSTLDSYFKDIDTKIQFIKCDVETHEYEVFRGGINLLKRDLPMLLIEIHEERIKSAELPNQLFEIGYEGFFIHRGNKLDFSVALETPYRKKTQSHRNYFFESTNTKRFFPKH